MVSSFKHPYIKYKQASEYAQDRHVGVKLDSLVQSDIEKLKGTFAAFDPKLDTFKREVNKRDMLTKERKMIFTALSPLSPVRRISSVEDNIKEHNYFRAAGLVGLAAANLPEDWKDIKMGYNQVFKAQKPKYDCKNYQHPFSFFRGTFLEPLLNMKSKTGEKVSDFLYTADRSLFETGFGQKICKLLKVEAADIIETAITDAKGNLVTAYSVKGKPFAKLIARAMLRMPVITIFVLSTLEIPQMIKSFFKKDNDESNLKSGSKQLFKSIINISAISGGIGIFGALLARKGAAGSLLGMGIGSILGALTSKKASKVIDSI